MEGVANGPSLRYIVGELSQCRAAFLQLGRVALPCVATSPKALGDCCRARGL